MLTLIRVFNSVQDSNADVSHVTIAGFIAGILQKYSSRSDLEVSDE